MSSQSPAADIIAIAQLLTTVTFSGLAHPWIASVSERSRNPLIGDLVVEVTLDDGRPPRLGFLREIRDGWQYIVQPYDSDGSDDLWELTTVAALPSSSGPDWNIQDVISLDGR